MIKLPEPAGYLYYDDACGCEVAPPTPHYTEEQLKQAIRDALDDASKACETRAKYWQRDDSRVEEDLQCSTVIRLLKDEIK